MPEPRVFPALALFCRDDGRPQHDRTAYIAVMAGVTMMVLLTVNPAYEAAHHWVDAVLWACLPILIFEWMVRLRHAMLAQRLRAMRCPAAAWSMPPGDRHSACHRAWHQSQDGLAACGALGAEGGAGIPGLRQLRRVLVQESGPLLSVLVIFLMVLLLASVAVYFLERDVQPGAFGSVPAALWWAVATLTTTGYGDVVPITPLGRLVAAIVMICGLGVFGLWTGILATGFAAETRRDNFLKTWESVSKVPFFAALGPSAIADVTHMLRTMDLPARTMIIRKGQAGDCMYFIAEGEVEVDLPGKKVSLGEGAFFGEMALLGNNLRSANIITRGCRNCWCSISSISAC